MQLLILRTALLSAALLTVSAGRSYDECETLPSTIHVTQEERDDNGRLIRQCEEDVLVSKCEGSCQSKVQPSVNTLSGFYKDCRCCRETSLHEREVLLTRCYDGDGIMLGGSKATMKITMKEPSDCTCYKCGDPTR
ncbi:Bursicon beta precursor protein [Hyalella azteca]|uniref:Bursicon beta protein n=1 Tax=Hyalella azteca TaxID=294128 RepID=A0A6A0GTK3_HYAAZ|nr:partner of bursicon [Hyalella azteca]KAA0187652.1 Bursicon beta precursor protein [Hyalella azteca]